MDCRDLTISDFVKYNGATKVVDAVYLYSVSVHDPSEEWSISEAKTYPVDDIEPIPITEDILVKNGFEYEEDTFLPDTGYWSLSDEDGILYFTIDAYGVKGSGEVAFGYQVIALEYVHQLQHLLWLAGVQKEIEL